MFSLFFYKIFGKMQEENTVDTKFKRWIYSFTCIFAKGTFFKMKVGESGIRECIKWLCLKTANMPLCLSELCACRKVSIALQRIKIWHKREQLELPGEHDLFSNTGVQRENKGMNSHLLPPHLFHLAPSPLLVAMPLTLHFDVANSQNLLVGFWLQNEPSFTLATRERASTHRCQPEECLFLIFLLSQKAKHGLNHPTVPSFCCLAAKERPTNP